MSIKDELNAELKDAMRTKDRRRLDVIRAVETEVSRAKAAPGFSGGVDDDLYRKVISAFVKKMKRGLYAGVPDGLLSRDSEMQVTLKRQSQEGVSREQIHPSSAIRHMSGGRPSRARSGRVITSSRCSMLMRFMMNALQTASAFFMTRLRS